MTRLLTCLLILLSLMTPAAATELRVATWNLDWLTLRPLGDPSLPDDVVPKHPEDRARLRRYGQLLDADIIAVQEVDGPEVLAQVFPPDRYQIIMTGDDVVQRTGFAIRRGLVVERNPDLTALDIDPNARFHLRSGADITVVLPGARLRLLDVHLKTGCHDKPLGTHTGPCATLSRQVAPLQGWIRQRRAEAAAFLLLGDFNRVMDGNDGLLNALNDAAPLTRATEGRSTPCWGGNTFIDHILAGGAARAWMDPGTLGVITYRETDPAAKDHLSDHCPVFVRIHLPD